jgi:ribosomal protein L37AE/L43A
MSIDRQSGNLIFCCDSCDAQFKRPIEDEFDPTWAAAKREGWRAQKIGQDWIHACPDCEIDR